MLLKLFEERKQLPVNAFNITCQIMREMGISLDNSLKLKFFCRF